MLISDFVFRMGSIDEYVMVIDGVRYESYVEIPDSVYAREIYTWRISDIGNMTIKIDTLESDIEIAIGDGYIKFPEFTNEQIILMIRSGVTLNDILNQMRDEEEE